MTGKATDWHTDFSILGRKFHSKVRDLHTLETGSVALNHDFDGTPAYIKWKGWIDFPDDYPVYRASIFTTHPFETHISGNPVGYNCVFVGDRLFAWFDGAIWQNKNAIHSIVHI